MTITGPVDIVGCHAEGEVGDVIVGGVDPPPGSTLWEQARWIAADGTLRDFVLNEPRGGVFRHVNLLVPPKNPKADVGFIIMEPAHTPPMSGSNSICVATVVLETGLVPMTEPVSHLTLEAPGGLVEVVAYCADGKAHRIEVTNVASFVDRRDATIELDGYGSIRVDTAYGGDSFVLIDAATLGVSLDPSEARELAELGMRLTAAATDQLGFRHPTNPDWNHVSFCQFAGPLTLNPDADADAGSGRSYQMKNTVAIEPGKLDRSPTGTGLSARMALLRTTGEMTVGDQLRMSSIIDSVFDGMIVADTDVDGTPAIVPLISGRAWITGTQRHVLDPDDPWPHGYRVADTWPPSPSPSNPTPR